MVSTICHHNIPIGGNSHALWTVQWTCQGINKGQKRALGIKDLDPGVTPIRHQDIILFVCGHARWGVKLAISFSIGTEAKQKLAL